MCICAPLLCYSNVTQETARKSVLDKVNDEYGGADIEVFENKELVDSIRLVGKTLECESSWAFFVDLYPNAGWEHDCLYLFVNPNDGSIEEKSDLVPPKNMSEWSLMDDFKSLSFAPNGSAFSSDGLIMYDFYMKSNVSAPNSYAVIIDGGIDKDRHDTRYWNDCSLFYQMLVNVFGYDKQKIYVLMSDGTSSGLDMTGLRGLLSSPLDLDGDGKADINYSATRQNITKVFNELSSKMTSKDELLIFTTDHGKSSNGALYLWNEETITPREFHSEVSKVNCKSKLLLMGQCYSGAFIPYFSEKNTTICTASRATEESWGYKFYYDVFHFYMTNSLAQSDIVITNADVDGNGKVSVAEAFRYTLTQDHNGAKPQYYSYNDMWEHQYVDRWEGTDLTNAEDIVWRDDIFTLKDGVVSLCSDECEGAELSVYSLNGGIIYGRRNLNSGIEVNVNGWSHGVYVWELKGENYHYVQKINL